MPEVGAQQIVEMHRENSRAMLEIKIELAKLGEQVRQLSTHDERLRRTENELSRAKGAASIGAGVGFLSFLAEICHLAWEAMKGK